MKHLQFAVNEVLYNGHLQALGAAVILYLANIYLNIKSDYLEIFSVYILFVFIFINDRAKHIIRDTKTNAIRSKHLRSYQLYLPWLLVFCLWVFMGLFLINSGLRTTAFALLIAIAGYMYPMVFKNITKYIPGFKNIYVSMVYPLVVVFLVSAKIDITSQYSYIYVYIGAIFFESWLCQIILDIKDVASDKLHGLLTFGVLFGIDNTLHLASLLNIGIGAVLVVLAYYLNAPKALTGLFLVTIFTNQVIVVLIHKRKTVGYLISAGMFLWWWFFDFCIRLL